MVKVVYRKKCPKCHGSGDVDCPACGGDGYSWYGGQCSRCYGMGVITCDECNGSGDIEVDEDEDY